MLIARLFVLKEGALFLLIHIRLVLNGDLLGDLRLQQIDVLFKNLLGDVGWSSRLLVDEFEEFLFRF